MSSEFKFCKIRKVKNPNRGTERSAGIDFYIPEDLTREQLEAAYSKINQPLPENIEIDSATNFIKTITLNEGEVLFIPSGIRCIIPQGHMLKFDNKSGIATKKGLMIGANIVDEDYRLECHLHLIKVSKGSTTVEAGDKICQGIIIPVEYSAIQEVSVDIIENDKTTRIGGFGSTGLK